jgi:hypothetical protein
MSTLVLGVPCAKCGSLLSFPQLASDAPLSGDSRSAALLGALFLLCVALMMLGRAVKMLQAVWVLFQSVLAAVLGTALVAGALVLLIAVIALRAI